jgi:hypothetical protein
MLLQAVQLLRIAVTVRHDAAAVRICRFCWLGLQRFAGLLLLLQVLAGCCWVLLLVLLLAAGGESVPPVEGTVKPKRDIK